MAYRQDDFEYVDDDDQEPAPDYGYEPGLELYEEAEEPPEELFVLDAPLLPSSPSPLMMGGMTLMACMIMILFLYGVSRSAVFAINAGSAISAEEATAVAAGLESQAQAGAVDLAGQECLVSDLFPEKVRRWCGLISAYANQHSLSPDLVAALIWLESGGDEVAYSTSGAVGLMQVMPRDGLAAGFQCVAGPCFSDRPTIEQLQDPEFNIAYGTRMLAGLVNRKGDLREALKSYGPMDVGYSYADKVMGIFQRYQK